MKRNRAKNHSGLNKRGGNSPVVSGAVGVDTLYHAIFKDLSCFLLVALLPSGSILVTVSHQV